MFFANFFSWLDLFQTSTINAQTLLVANAVTPAATAFATLYVTMWGWGIATGRIQQPLKESVRHMLIMMGVFGVGLKLSMYNELITDTFMNGPTQLAAAMSGGGAAASPAGLLDTLLLNGGSVAEGLMAQGGIMDGGFGFYLAAFVVYALIGGATAYVAFLLALSKMMLTVIISLGPLFIVMFFFEPTRSLFQGWVAQMANYAVVGLVGSALGMILLRLIQDFGSVALAAGNAVTIADTVYFCLAAAIALLVLKQAVNMAAGLAGGVGMATFGVISKAMGGAIGGARNTAYQGARGFGQGLSGGRRSAHHTLRQNAANLLRQSVRAGAGAAFRTATGGGNAVAASGGGIPRDQIMPPRRTGT